MAGQNPFGLIGTNDPADPGESSVDLAPDAAERLAVGFSRVLRELQVPVPASATINFTQALGVVGLTERTGVYWAGRATLVRRPEDLPMFERAFAAFWQGRHPEYMSVEGTPPPITLALDSGDDNDGDDDEVSPPGDIQSVRFSRSEVLTDKDFGSCTKEELEQLSRLMTQLRFTTHRRSSRRQIPVKGRGDQPDLRRTVRWAISHHGEPMKRAFTDNATRPRRLVLILDVSGSMETYARALIRFVHAAVVARGRVEAFALGTRLTRITRQLSNRDPDAAIRSATPEVKDWAGGTRLGEGIGLFNDEWGIRGMARGSVVVVLSDGWDRGDPAELGEQMERLHRVTHELIWVNPLKATEGYAPLAAGMAAALPHTDRFIAGNSYRRLEELATILAGSSAASRGGARV